MNDNGEARSRATGSARQDPARPATTKPELSTRGAAQSNLSMLSEAGDQPEPRPVSADMQQFIGRQLRAVFDDVAKQPVPDRFLELMKQLDSKTGA